MSCVIDLGQTSPCTLRVLLIPGEVWTSAGMTRANGQAWPSAPRLAFASGQSWVATLSGDALTAVITATGDQTAAVRRGEVVALRSDDVVYALGNVRLIEGVPT